MERTNENAGSQKLLVAPWRGELCFGGLGEVWRDCEGGC